MNDNPASFGSDRLPWLPDERRARRIGAAAIMLSSAVTIALIVAGLSYLPSTIRTGAVDSFRQFTATPGQAPTTRSRQPRAEYYASRPVQPPPAAGQPPPGAPASGAVAAVLPAPSPITAVPPRVVPAGAAAALPAIAESGNPPAATAPQPAPQPAAGTTNDCRLARTKVALAICRNLTLARLDREHALLFGQSLRHANPAKRALLLSARQRLTAHLNACPTDSCSTGIYLAAMRELSGIMAARVAAASGPAAKPSFNCRAAKRRGEIAVCNDANLAELDRHQALLYRQSWGRADPAKRARLQRAQERLIARRERCGTQPCTKSVYLGAMQEVTEIMITR